MKYSLSEIAAVCGGRLSGRDIEVGRVMTDSRSEPRRRDMAGEEALFVAIRTKNRDGAAYIEELYARGVRGFLVGDDFPDAAKYPEAGFVAVKDTVAALQALATHYRTGLKGKVVGITGSYGKTTVKEWIAQLTPTGRAGAGKSSTIGPPTLFRSPKSYNSQIGVPLSILMATGNEDYIVIEAGISEPGEMAVLQKIIRPDIGILTSVGGAHEENFASTEQLCEEKRVLFRDCPVVLYGEGDDFNERNKALAATFWESQGYPIATTALENLEPVAMRLEVKEGLYGSVIINDTYNSDLNSFGIALDYLGRVAGNDPKMVVMPENPRAAKLVKDFGIEHCVEIGSNFTVEDFLRSVTSSHLAGHTILIKGGARLGFDRICHALEARSHTTVLEVNLDAVIHNLGVCRSRLAPGVGVMPMIKADAYGHGSFEVARTLEEQGVDYLAVAFADEGVALREAGITMPIVVLNADADSFERMIAHRLEPEIYNFVSLGEFTRLLKRHGEQHYPIHIKLDTGMHRLGFLAGDIPALISAISGVERYARVSTIFSHLAAADDPTEDDFTRGQIERFENMSRTLCDALPYPTRRHIANTKGIERFPEAQFDLVRLGIGLYGFGMHGSRPVATLKTRIVNIARLAAGETVGYNRRGILTRPSLVATIPIGYADGLNRRLSNGGRRADGGWSMLVGGRNGDLHPAPIVGNVCMDSCMIDVSGNGHDGTDGVSMDNEVMVGDEVTIFSPIPGNTIEDMADVLGTIPYEVMTSISGRVKHIYVKE